MSIAERIREARKAANLTQAELGESIGLSQGAIAGYESGRREPDVLQIKKIVKALSVTGDWLLEITMVSKNDSERDELMLIYDKVNDAGRAQIIKQARYVATDEEYKKKADATNPLWNEEKDEMRSQPD